MRRKQLKLMEDMDTVIKPRPQIAKQKKQRPKSIHRDHIESPKTPIKGPPGNTAYFEESVHKKTPAWFVILTRLCFGMLNWIHNLRWCMLLIWKTKISKCRFVYDFCVMCACIYSVEPV